METQRQFVESGMTEQEVWSSLRQSSAWQRAMDLSVSVYSITQRFPKEEMFGLTNQLRRAAVSIASNIAEGKGRRTSSEFFHFLGIAQGSALEVQTQLELASRLGFGEPKAIRSAQELTTEILKMLNASFRSNKARIKP